MINRINKIQIEKAKLNIEKQLPDKDVYNGQLFQQFLGVTSSCNFRRKSLKRVNVKGTTFKKACFVASAGTGSKFRETYFQKCDFTGANFQNCYFDKCTFCSKTLMKGTNFSQSIFIDCVFKNITIKRSTLYDCHFENCTFESCKIYSNTLENSLFYMCLIKHVDLAHINLEYMQIKSTKMDDVKLPPYQIPYIIGAPQFIKTTADNVLIYTDKGELNASQYYALYEDLILYYYSHGEYFPLANILMALGRHQEALEYIKIGIQEACDYFDFRMLKHFCRLVCSDETYTPSQLKEIYNMITNLSFNENWDLNTLHSYMLHIGAIRELLLNNSEFKSTQRLEIQIKTNIAKDDLSSINELYNTINLIIRNNCSKQHTDCIELRHNSPYELYITFIDSLPYIISLLSSLYGLFAAGNKIVDIYKNVLETQKIKKENAILDYEKEEKQLDIEIKRMELEHKKKKCNSESIVTEIEHNIKCKTLDDAKEIALEVLHYKFEKKPPER